MIAVGGEVGRVAKLHGQGEERARDRERNSQMERDRRERVGRETQFGFVEPARRRLATRVAEFTLLAEQW